jgi:hypothetical protein
MGKILNLFVIVTISLFVSSCEKDLKPEIESLMKPGEEFYFGERVPVWASTQNGDWQTQYEWSATGGYFDGWRTQNLFENLWVAPNVPGDYTITVTAKNGSQSSSRSTNMKVTRYFFDEFQSDRFTLGEFGWLTSNAAVSRFPNADTALSRIIVDGNTTAVPNIRRNLNLAPLRMPFSIRTRVGYTTWPRANTAMLIRLFFNQPANPNQPFIREIRWEIWPTNTGTTANYRIQYETFLPSANLSRFSTTTSGAVFPVPAALIDPVNGRNNIFQMPAGELRNFTMSIDRNEVFHAHVNGALWFSSNSIKDWLTSARAAYPGLEVPTAREYRVEFPARATATGPSTNLILKHVYINDNDEILR